MTRRPSTGPWRLATRTERMNPSAIREILKLTERPGNRSADGRPPASEMIPGRSVSFRISRIADGFMRSVREARRQGPDEG